jgi:hypothetical protein
LSPEEAGRLVGALRTHRDRAMVLAMLQEHVEAAQALNDASTLRPKMIAERDWFAAMSRARSRR